MFDGSLPEPAALASLDDATLVAAAAGWARVESAAAARKQAVMAELFRRRTGLDDAEDRELWWVDPSSAVAAELAAAQGISQGMALSQTHRGVTLQDRLPKVAALFTDGLISDMLVRTIVYRAALITDAGIMAAVDAELAEQVARWGALSLRKTEHSIDAIILSHDAAAVRRTRQATRSRDVAIGSATDEPGITTLWARLFAPDAAALDERLTAMARSVCSDDPRSFTERRADALGALTGGSQTLACACGRPDCAAGDADATPRNVVIHVITDAATLDAARDDLGRSREEAEEDLAGMPTPDGGEDAAPADTPSPDTASRDHEPHRSRCAAPAYVVGGGVLDAMVLAAFLQRATVRELQHPGDGPPEQRYRPSAALEAFVRARDLHCRFPGCDRAASVCDVDHTVPYPAGPTCASNLKCLCRYHHLLKTFCTGATGWRERQLPDGAVIWTSPSGSTHITRPGSALMFPALCRPTAPAQIRPVPGTAGDPTVKMPRRRRTREQDRAYRITAERKLNDDIVAERNMPPSF